MPENRIRWRESMPFGHLMLRLTGTECGAVTWALVPQDDHGTKAPLMSGPISDGFAAELDLAAASVRIALERQKVAHDG